MKILITGGAGYLGSHTISMLNEIEHEILIVDNFSTPQKQLLKKFNHVIADITDRAKINDILSQFSPDIVIHLAAISGISSCQKNSELCKKVNLEGTRILLEAMKKTGVSNLIFASSSTVYSHSEKALTESYSLDANNEYGKSKLAAEKIISEYSTQGIKSIILRIFNIAGIGPEEKFDELIYKDNHLLPAAIKAASNNEALPIFGNNYNTPDGTAIRDYVHVSDVARAITLACNHLKNGGESDIFNIASGNPTSVNELCNIVEKHTSKKLDTSLEKTKISSTYHLLADISKAKNKLGWEPIFSDIDSIVQTATQRFEWESN